MKSFQVRLSDDVYEAIREIAEARNTSLADVIRESLEAYAIGCHYADEGKQLFWEDPKTGVRAEILIPGFTMRRLRQRSEHEGQLASPSPASGLVRGRK